MCYLSEYTCKVSCLNGELDLASAINGTIHTAGNRLCDVSCIQTSIVSGGANQYGTAIADQIYVYGYPLGMIAMAALVIYLIVNIVILLYGYIR